MNPDYMKQVQAAGWGIVTADEKFVWVGCARSGCSFQFKLREGAAIPATCRPQPVLHEIVIRVFDDLRIPLRARREQLCLSIKDVEDAAGLATDHLAKFEKDESLKLPNFQTAVEWADSLGYEFIIRQKPIPQVTLGLISRTRHLLVKRMQSFRHFRAVRAQRK